MRKTLGILLAAIALLNAGSALAAEPVIDIVCSITPSGPTQKIQIFKKGDGYTAIVTAFEEEESWEKEITYIDDDVIKLPSSSLLGEENTEISISRATGAMNTILFSINENGKRDVITIIPSGNCVKNRKLF